MATTAPFGPVFEFILGRCARPAAFPAPWDFVSPSVDVRGPVVDGEATLAALRGRFDPEVLWQAEVLQPVPGAPDRLAPQLVSPAGFVLPLRAGPMQPPFALLTARGTIPRVAGSIGAALADAATAEGIRAFGALFAAAYPKDVLLLRALDLPATLTAGLARCGAQEFAWLDETIIYPDYPPADGRPSLALLGRTLFPPGGPAPALTHAVSHLAAARRHLGVPLAGVTAWVPTVAEVDSLRFRARLRDVGAVRDLLAESARVLADFESLMSSGPEPPVGYAAALASLEQAVAADDGSVAAAEYVARARAVYSIAARKDVVGPLAEWAAGLPTPVGRAAGAELATGSALLRGLAPDVVGLLARGSDALSSPLFDRYLKLSGRFAGLIGTLARATKEGL